MGKKNKAEPVIGRGTTVLKLKNSLSLKNETLTERITITDEIVKKQRQRIKELEIEIQNNKRNEIKIKESHQKYVDILLSQINSLDHNLQLCAIYNEVLVKRNKKLERQ
jgi:hypothetical protein